MKMDKKPGYLQEWKSTFMTLKLRGSIEMYHQLWKVSRERQYLLKNMYLDKKLYDVEGREEMIDAIKILCKATLKSNVSIKGCFELVPFGIKCKMHCHSEDLEVKCSKCVVIVWN